MSFLNFDTFYNGFDSVLLLVIIFLVSKITCIYIKSIPKFISDSKTSGLVKAIDEMHWVTFIVSVLVGLSIFITIASFSLVSCREWVKYNKTPGQTLERIYNGELNTTDNLKE